MTTIPLSPASAYGPEADLVSRASMPIEDPECDRHDALDRFVSFVKDVVARRLAGDGTDVTYLGI